MVPLVRAAEKMADLEALANNLTLARKHVDQNDNVTASLYYETTLSMINK